MFSLYFFIDRLNNNLDIGDTLKATAGKVDDQWLINNDVGLLVYEPDVLISTTSVVGTLFSSYLNQSL